MPLPEEHAALIPEEVRSDPTILNFNDVGSIAKSYVDARKLIGNSIQLPGKDSKPEDLTKWVGEQGPKLKDHGYTIARLGDQPPESPDKYEFKIEGVADEQIKGDKVLGTYRQAAHKLGINQAQAAGLFDVFAKEIYPQLQQPMPEFVDDGDGLLQKKYGGESTQIKQESELALRHLQPIVPELNDMIKDGVIELEQGKFVSLGNYPPFKKMLSELGKLMTQDFGGNIGASLVAGDTMDSVDAKIAELRKEVDGTKNQSEQQRLGLLLDEQYKKKAALMQGKRAA